MTQVPWKVGRQMVWDATCIDTLAATHLTFSTVKPGSAAKNAKVRKFRNYSSVERRFIFCSLCSETFGPWGPSAVALTSDIGRKLAKVSGESRSCTFLCQSLSIGIQRGNAAAVLGALPHSRGFGEIFYVLSSHNFS